MRFLIRRKSKKSQARTALLRTTYGNIHCPFFMPIATKGAVKYVDSIALSRLGAEIILANTYHLLLRPGISVIENANGLHSFMQWKRPILTDSGGFQVFSLSKISTIDDHGVHFISHYDGAKLTLSPERAIEIQKMLGSDIMMCLDVCPQGKAAYSDLKHAVLQTTNWAERCKQYLNKSGENQKCKQALFGIVQGGHFKRLRRMSAQALESMNFDGYAIGGVSVGESRSLVGQVVEFTSTLLPENKPRYLMGVGRPEEIVMAVKAGVDMFDCVIPTREARHGRLYFFCDSSEKDAIPLWKDVSYRTISITNRRYKNQNEEISPRSSCKELRLYSLAYLHHLMSINEGLGYRIATLNNIEFYLQFMKGLREAILQDEI
jgi:queuine tRNA-ribosyltransferase